MSDMLPPWHVRWNSLRLDDLSVLEYLYLLEYAWDNEEEFDEASLSYLVQFDVGWHIKLSHFRMIRYAERKIQRRWYRRLWRWCWRSA